MKTSNNPSTIRRRMLLAAVAAAAAGTGAWMASRRQRLDPAQDSGGFWQQSFNDPTGQAFDLSGLKKRRVLVNFWASWCPPCVEEMPLLSQFYEAHPNANWKMLGLAVDRDEPVRRFLAKHPVSFPVAMAGFEGIELSKSLGNRHGSLPFTVVLGPDGQIAHRKLGQLNENDLTNWLSNA